MIEWVAEAVVLAIHDEQIAEHGGPGGVRDMSVLRSALGRPQNLQAYGEPPPDVADLAAAYAFGISQNQAFFDGNKRTSSVVTILFLHLNGYQLLADQADRLEILSALGAGTLAESELAEWMRQRLAKRSSTQGEQPEPC